jgi:hypothetical protein
MNYQNIQDKWFKAKEGFKSVLYSLKKKENEEPLEIKKIIVDDNATKGDYNYDKESETGQAERYS